MSNLKTDNQHLDAKVQLRARHLPDKSVVSVLDCFHGEGVVWDAVRSKLPGRDIRVVGIDQRRGLGGLYLHGDNRKYLSSMDLDSYDVIDLDAYGCPFDQLEILFSRKIASQKTVFFTYCKVSLGMLPYGLLEAVGFPRRMVAKCPSLFGRNQMEKMEAYLYLGGIRELSVVECRSRANKQRYIHFDLPASKDRLAGAVSVGYVGP